MAERRSSTSMRRSSRRVQQSDPSVMDGPPDAAVHGRAPSRLLSSTISRTPAPSQPASQGLELSYTLPTRGSANGLTQLFLQKDSLIQDSSDLRPLANAILQYTRATSMAMSGCGDTLRFFLPDGRLADEWIDLFLITPDWYLSMAPLDVRYAFSAQKNFAQTATTSFKGWMQEQIRQREIQREIAEESKVQQVALNHYSPQPIRTGPFAIDPQLLAIDAARRDRATATIRLGGALLSPQISLGKRKESARTDEEGQQDGHDGQTVAQLGTPRKRARISTSAPDNTRTFQPGAPSVLSSASLQVLVAPTTTAATTAHAPAPNASTPTSGAVRLPPVHADPRATTTLAAPVLVTPVVSQGQPPSTAPVAPAANPANPVNAFIASAPNRATRRHIGRGNKKVAMSHGHIRAYVELLGRGLNELPPHANSEWGHEMKSVATPETVDLTLLGMPVTAQEIMAFTPYASVIHEVAERLHRSWTPKQIADYMSWVRNLQHDNSYQRTMFSHQYNPSNVPSNRPVSNVPSTMSRASNLDKDRKKTFHDYFLWDMGQGVVRYPAGRAAQLLTHVIWHVRNVTGDRNVLLSQVQQYATQHHITVPAADVILPDTNVVMEDTPSEAFLNSIDAEFRRKFNKSSSNV